MAQDNSQTQASGETKDTSPATSTLKCIETPALAAVIIGDDGDNALVGGPGDDLLEGLGGNDTLDGDAGDDSMYGGLGDDTYVVESTGDVVTENLDEGIDRVISHINHSLTDNVENLTLASSAGAISGIGNALGNKIIGNDSANVLDGGAGSDTLNAGDGDDILYGGEGGDTLDGGAGDDFMAGGLGGDTYVVDTVGDVVTEAAGEGIDRVFSHIDYVLGADVENLFLFLGAGAINGTGNVLSNLIVGNESANILDGGIGNDTLNAGGGADILFGGEGSDTLDGNAGDDSMFGGQGDDTYVVDTTGDVIVEAADEGTDRVFSHIDYVLGANVENLILFSGAGAINGIGNALGNHITGNESGNRLDGGAGNDTLFGLGGADFLDGGEGDDILVGGAGSDILEGGSGADIQYGNEGSDILDGGAGDDTMIGGLGDDTYVIDSIGDVVTENLDEGIDRVISHISHVLTDNLENLTLAAAAGAINGTGNALNNNMIGNDSVNVLDGGAGSDTLNAGGGADILYGGEGSDTLNGNAGDDFMAGGQGGDTYVVDSVGDVVAEAAGEGIDRVFSHINYVLGADVENLFLFSGAGAINGTGNALDNLIFGNEAANILDGGAGSDTLMGGSGADTLRGGEENDTLDGGAGDDSMVGGLGDDTYVVNTTGDVVVEAVGEGTDRVFSSIDYTLDDNLENLTHSESGGNLEGIGNFLNNLMQGNSHDDRFFGLAGDDTLRGDEGNDLLDGGAGDDLMVGGAGDDVLNGGAGTDTLAGGAGSDTIVYNDIVDAGDLILGFNASGEDTIDLDALLDGLGVADTDRSSRVDVQQAGTGADAVISIDTTGDGIFDTVLATVEGVFGDLDQNDMNLGTLV